MKWTGLVNKVVGGIHRIHNKEVTHRYREEPREDPRDILQRAMDEFKNVSRSNWESTLSFLNHRRIMAYQNYGGDIEKDNDLMRVISNPGSVRGMEGMMADEEELYVASGVEIHDLNRRKSPQEYAQEMNRKIKEMYLSTKEVWEGNDAKPNCYFLTDVDEGSVLELHLVRANIGCAMIISDTFKTRETALYQKVLKMLERNSIQFVEFTNVQPLLDKKLIFRMCEFAGNHNVNSLIVIGSLSTIEVSKLLIPKLMQPNIISLHKNREFDVAIADKYTVFTIPTFVVPDVEVNSRSAVKNNIINSKWHIFDSALFLKGQYDDSKGVFYCREVFDILSVDKVKEVLHETFFRLIFSYFDLAVKEDTLGRISEGIKRIEMMLDMVYVAGELGDHEKDEFLKIFAFTADGTITVDVLEFWLLHKLEGSLSLLVNSRKTDGLALFMPVFIEVLSQRNVEFRNRAIMLGTSVYQVYSVEGLIYKLIRHIEKYDLPTTLLDIPQVKKIDYKFLSSLLKNANLGYKYGSIVKAVMQHLQLD